MSKHAKHVPTHRGAAKSHVAVVAPRKALRNTLVMSSVAVAATGITVGGGLVTSSPAAVTAAATDLGAKVGDTGTSGDSAAARDRTPGISRSEDRRDTADPLKETVLSAASGPAVSGRESLADDSPQDIASALLSSHGWGQDQFGCLDSLWTRESGWNPRADNPSSSAYGIPQALPGSKMASVGADWATNPVTQITWGLDYIAERYGSPCGAWGHSESFGNY